MTLVDGLRGPTAEEQRAAVAALVARGDPSEDELSALAECLGHPRKAVQRPAAEAFAALDARGVAVRDRLLGMLAAPDARRRWGAAYALSLLGPPPPAAVPVLIETLGSDDGDLRWAAARILPHAGERDGTVELLRGLLRTGNAPQRKMALYCLRDLEARLPAIEEEMIARLDDPDRDVRLAAIGALARVAVDRDRVAFRLVEVLERDEPPVRRAAAAALGAVGSAAGSVVAGLRVAAAGSDPALRRAAERALAALGV